MCRSLGSCELPLPPGTCYHRKGTFVPAMLLWGTQVASAVSVHGGVSPSGHCPSSGNLLSSDGAVWVFPVEPWGCWNRARDLALGAGGGEVFSPHGNGQSCGGDGGTGSWPRGCWQGCPCSAPPACAMEGACVLMAKHTGSELRREKSCSSKARYWHKHKRI